jgi:rod shape-determining protein MreC
LSSLAASRDRPQRGTPAGLRFFGYAVIALVLMWADQRGGILDRIRYGLQAAAYPLQIALNSPAAAWRWTRDLFEQRASLQAENRALRDALRASELQGLRRAALERENAELRGLRDSLRGVAAKWLPANVIAQQVDAQRHRLTVDRGARNGVTEGQVVVAGGGIVGQSLRVGPRSTEVILISDPSSGVPVQNLRTGARSLAIGSGKPGELSLPYLPLQTDILAGDLLVTSGLGGIFPAGYPVAKVAEVRRDSGSPLAVVRAQALAALDRDRVLSFVWFEPGHPAAPATPAAPPAAAPPAAAPPAAAPPAAAPSAAASGTTR